MPRRLLTPPSLPQVAGNPAGVADAQVWYDLTEKKLRGQENGLTLDMRGQAELGESRLMGQEGIAQPVRETGTLNRGAVSVVVASASIFVRPVWLNAGDSITNLASMYSGTGTAVAGLSRMWMALYDSAGAKILQTADQAAAAWAANTVRKLALVGGPYAVVTSGIYYVAFYWVATTAGTMICEPTAAHAQGWADLRTKVFPNAPVNYSAFAGLASTAVAPANLPALTLIATRPWIAAL